MAAEVGWGGGRGKVGGGVSSRVMYLIWCLCTRNFLEQEPMKMDFSKFPTLKLIYYHTLA